MDPNATLARLRELLAVDPDESPEAALENFDEVAEKFKALDEWMSNGGFLPTDWRDDRDRDDDEGRP